MAVDIEALEAFIKKAGEKKYGKKKTRKKAFEDYQKYRLGLHDPETGVERIPTRLRKAAPKPNQPLSGVTKND